MRFLNRREAGRELAQHLAHHKGKRNALVLALPRGGVPVAYEVAALLELPLDVFIVRKLGVPGHEELALGALASGGATVWNEDVVAMTGIAAFERDEVARREQAEITRRERAYRGDAPVLDVRGKTVILVDDGLATGSTMKAGIEALRKLAPTHLVMAVPVAPPETLAALRPLVDEIACVHAPRFFAAVGQFYDDFTQTSDDEVRALLRAARGGKAPSPPRSIDVRVRAGDAECVGTLSIPASAQGVVLFAHGSGSGRHSPRNRAVATALQKGGLATLLLDLLTEEEEAVDAVTGHLRFDIGFLAGRLIQVMGWLERSDAAGLPLGLFGASTGAAAALVAAARAPTLVHAVVSRGGRPDLAGDALARVRASTLLLVGSRDTAVLDMNRAALARLRALKSLVVVPGATHLFEEPGTLEEVAHHAVAWFQRYLREPAAVVSP